MNDLSKVEVSQLKETMTSVEIAELTGKSHDKVCRDIANILEYKSCDTFFEKSTYTTKRNRVYGCYIISKKGISILNINYKNKELSEFCGQEYIASFNRFENSFGELLKSVLNYWGIIFFKQYRVYKYRIDFYIPRYKLAIEYDENQHNYFNNIVLDKQREKYIKYKLKCRLIRLDYHKTDIDNLNIVLKQIFKLK